MRYQVYIHFGGTWFPIGYPYAKRDDAEWAIARWRQENGSNGCDTGLCVREVVGFPLT